MRKVTLILAILMMFSIAVLMAGCGEKEKIECTRCFGTGEIVLTENAGQCVQCGGTGTDPRTQDQCGKCYGKGYYEKVVSREKCEECDGKGFIEK